MQTPEKLLAALVLLAGSLAAQTPTITGIVNGASALPPGLPNSGIAAGSIFVVYGTNLGPVPPGGGPVASASVPLPISFLGTTLIVTVNGTSANAPILYTSQTQVAAVMPSTISPGTGTLKVDYNGQDATSPVTVVTSGFGISNLRIIDGHETAAMTFGTNPSEPVTLVDEAAPGDVVVLFGTGLGPANNNADNTFPIQGNVGAVPTVYVGGVPSPNVSYYGRSPALPGLDQIIFTIPPNAPQGCHVSIVVQTSNSGVPIVSNAPATSIGPADHVPCVDPVNAFPGQLFGAPVGFNILGLLFTENQSFLPAPGSTAIPTKPAITDTYQVLTAQFTSSQFISLAFFNAQSTNGNCFAGFVPTSVATAPAQLPSATFLDSGTSLTLTPPTGSPIVLPAAGPGVFQGQDTLGIPFGTWAYSSPGGANVGPLNFTFPIGQPVTWTNQASIMAKPIDRTQGLTVKWSGGDPLNGFVDIQGFANNAKGDFLVGYDCSAPISAGSFTIPPSILLRMPSGTGPFFTFQVSTFQLPFNILPVKGFDAVVNFSHNQTIVPVAYQ